MRFTFQSPQSGFTLAELIAVILIVGILSVSAAAMFGRGGFDTAGYADLAQAQVAYARKVAIAQRRTTTVTFNTPPNTVSLTICAANPCAGTVPVTSPSGAGNFNSLAPAGVVLTTNPATGSFTFDPLGRPSGFAGLLTVTVSGSGSFPFLVEQETGYVHKP
ncbi:MAG TPA: prepilin-type N-terminal cleavage/methylation domain-containing protein [Burkholderiales bacterium]|nr:prepilin-type N-terminal cleavage/methylation domain-containing protein [Burkholderiales bacterium]